MFTQRATRTEYGGIERYEKKLYMQTVTSTYFKCSTIAVITFIWTSLLNEMQTPSPYIHMLSKKAKHKK